MLNKYYVQILALNQSGGNSQEVKAYADYATAEEKYFDALSQYCGNAQTGYCVIQLLDTYGRAIKSETIDHLPTPEPNAE